MPESYAKRVMQKNSENVSSATEQKRAWKNTFWTGNFTAESTFKKQMNKILDLSTELLSSEGKRFELKKIYPKIDAVKALTWAFITRIFLGMKGRFSCEVIMTSVRSWHAQFCWRVSGRVAFMRTWKLCACFSLIDGGYYLRIFFTQRSANPYA